MSDTITLDAIAEILRRRPRPGSGTTLRDVIELVESTGRNVSDTYPDAPNAGRPYPDAATTSYLLRH
jgi:hypothetical protein